MFASDIQEAMDDVDSLKGAIAVAGQTGIAVTVSPEMRTDEVDEPGAFRMFDREAYALRSAFTSLPALKATVTLSTLNGVADGTKYTLTEIETDGSGVRMRWRRRA